MLIILIMLTFIMFIVNLAVSSCSLETLGIPKNWEPGPGTPTGGTPGPGTQDPKMFRWDPGPGTSKVGPRTPKYLSGTRDFQLFL